MPETDMVKVTDTFIAKIYSFDPFTVCVTEHVYFTPLKITSLLPELFPHRRV